MRASPDDPFIGTAYRAIRRLGRGGAGEVWEAMQKTLGKRVAIKVMHGHLANKSAANKSVGARMQLEAQALARLQHPNIVDVFDMGLTQRGQPFFVMPLLQGRSLHEMIRTDGALPPQRARWLMLQLLSALSMLHEHELVHRDIKPANLFLCRERPPRLLVLDLGIMKVLEATQIAGPLAVPTQAGMAMGTPRFMAPEQVLDKPIDARTDVYAAGLVLYNMLAGRGPFDHIKTLPEMLVAQTCVQPAPASSFAQQPISGKLDRLVLRAIEKEPADRWPSAASFTTALQKLRLDVTEPEPPSPFDAQSLHAQSSASPSSAVDATIPMTPAEFGPTGTEPLDGAAVTRPSNATIRIDPQEDR